VVLPVPGGPQNTSEPRLFVSSMRVRAAVRAEQVVLADHLGKPVRTQPVGERARRIALQARRREQARSVGLGRRSSAEYGGDLLAAAQDGEPPQPRRLAVTRSRSFMVAIFSLLTLTTMSPFWIRSSGDGAVLDLGDRHAQAAYRAQLLGRAGDRLASRAPSRGERALITASSRGVPAPSPADRNLDLAPAPHDTELRLAAYRLGGEA